MALRALGLFLWPWFVSACAVGPLEARRHHCHLCDLQKQTHLMAEDALCTSVVSGVVLDLSVLVLAELDHDVPALDSVQQTTAGVR